MNESLSSSHFGLYTAYYVLEVDWRRVLPRLTTTTHEHFRDERFNKREIARICICVGFYDEVKRCATSNQGLGFE